MFLFFYHSDTLKFKSYYWKIVMDKKILEGERKAELADKGRDQ